MPRKLDTSDGTGGPSGVSGQYKMGAGGELPGGQAVIFHFSGEKQ